MTSSCKKENEEGEKRAGRRKDKIGKGDVHSTRQVFELARAGPSLAVEGCVRKGRGVIANAD